MVQKQKKEAAFRLRLQGKSYGEILKTLDLRSKGTLSIWFKDLKLSPEAKKLLRKKMLVARERNLFAFNKKRTESIIAENETILSQAQKEISHISDYDLKLIGAMLYWGEGTIHHGRYRYPNLSFTNSNHQIIKVYLLFLKRILKIGDSQISAGIYIHPNIEEKKARKFWSEIVGLPESRFFIVEQISAASKFKRDKKFLPYGTLHIKVSPGRQRFYQVQGYINGVVRMLIH